MIQSLKAKFPERVCSFVETKLGRIHYDDAGSKEADPILLIHGVSGPFAVWDKVVEPLVKAGHRVIRFDLFGRGMSERKKNAAYDLSLYLSQIEVLIAGLKVERPLTVIGSSLGAIIATEFALQYPQRVRGVVLIGPAGFPIQMPPIATLGSLPILGTLIFNSFGAEAIKTQNRKYFVDETPPKELWDYFVGQLAVPGTAEAMRNTMVNVPVQDFRSSYHELGKLGMPVGIIWGVNDVTFAYYHHKELLKLIPDAMFASVENAGHLPQYEQPAQTLVALLRQVDAIHKAPSEGLRRRVSPRLQPQAEINRQVEGKRIENERLFDNSFFQAWPSETKEVALSTGVSKEYRFPTFYNRVVTSVAMFTCDYASVSALIEDQGLEPVRVGPRHALLTMSSYRYNEVRGMEPYHEVAISVLVRSRGSSSGVITTLRSLMQMQGIEAYVLSMPVTTQENQIRGRTIWGLPKDVLSIRLRQMGVEFVTTVENTEGRMLYEFSVPMTGPTRQRHQKLRLRSVLNQRPLVSTTESKGDFVSSTSIDGFIARSGKRRLMIGDAAEGQWLLDLDISAVPFHTEFSTGTMAMLSAPEFS